LNQQNKKEHVRVELFLGEAPLFERKVSAGLLEFGLSHPGWLFSVRGASFRYTTSWLRANGIDGVLVVVQDAAVGGVLDKAGVPWVHMFPGQPVEHSSIDTDDQAIGQMGAEYLLGKGFHQFGFCGLKAPWSMDREKAFVDRLSASGRTADRLRIPLANRQDWLFSSAVEKRLDGWVSTLSRRTAVMVAHDALANRLVDLCLQRGLRVPQDIAVLGTGNHDLFCRLSPVAVSSIETAVPQAAYRAAEILKTMLQGGTAPASTTIKPTGVVERASTDILVYENELVSRILTYIREHAGDSLQVEDLVREFPVSRRSLSRYFAQVVGHSPAAEIRGARLRLARELLETSNLSMTDVAMASGYADLPHMDKSFRDALGVSPSALRSHRKLLASLRDPQENSTIKGACL
jgi:LacI family transcriptional regulator